MPTGNFGDVFAGYVAMRMGLPVERLTVATNVNDILVRTLETGTYEVRGVTATASPSMDIQVSSNFERLLFDAYGRDAGRGARPDGLAGAVAPASPLRRARSTKSVRASPPTRADEDETAADDPHHAARKPAICSTRTPRWRSRSPRRKAATARVPMVVLVHRASGEIPRRGRGRERHQPRTARLARRPQRAPGARDACCRPIRARSRQFILAASRAAQEGVAA